MRAAALLVLVAACQREWVRPYDGALPHGDDGRAVFLVRDYLTGKPVPWARVMPGVEWAMSPDGFWAPHPPGGYTDEFGLVALRVPRGPNYHWAVHAKGYAPTEAYGRHITEEIELHPPRTYVGRVLGIDGRPLADARVDWKVGCAHAPTLSVAWTDKNGLFVLDRIDDTGEFILEGPPGAADYIDAAPAPSPVPVNQILPGRTIRGRVVRADGTPAAWAVVCGAARAPRAVADQTGAFFLRGFAGGTLWAWWDRGLAEFPGDFARGVDVMLVVDGPPAEPPPVHVRVEIRDDGGHPPPVALPVHLDRVVDGRRIDLEWSPWGTNRGDSIPAGAYWLSVGDSWSAWVSERTLADTRDSSDLRVVVRPQPTLSFDLGLPDDAPARCWIVLEEESLELRDRDEPAHLPASGRAWLRVDLGGTPYTFMIGPEERGVRRADVRLPGRKFIRVPGLEDGIEADLLGEVTEIAQGPEPEDTRTESNGLWTYAVGERVLRLAHPERGFATVKIDLPFEARTLEPDCTLAPWPEPSELRVLRDDGKPVAGAHVTVLEDVAPDSAPPEPSETDGSGVVRLRWLRDGLHVRIDVPDAVPTWARLEGKPPCKVRLGTAAVVLDLSGFEAATGVLDGFVFETEEETITLGGLAEGWHTLVVGGSGRRALAYRLHLGRGETRRLVPRAPRGG